MQRLPMSNAPGGFAGQFHVVHNIAIDRDGNIYTTAVNRPAHTEVSPSEPRD
jgi:hypothetical protein